MTGQDFPLEPLHKMTSSLTMPRIPRYWTYLVGMNLVVMGIDMVASAGFTYIPPILLKFGFSESSMSFTCGLGPLISIFLVPIIGRCSDRAQRFKGNRLPYIAGLSGLLLVSLIIIPYANELGQLFSLGFAGVYVLVAVGVIVLDFATQALLNPCKSLVSDVTIDNDSSNKGFTVFSFMFSLGSCLGYLITSLDWDDTKIGNFVGNQEKVVFIFLCFLYLVFLVVSLTMGKRYSAICIQLNNNNCERSAEKLLDNGSEKLLKITTVKGDKGKIENDYILRSITQRVAVGTSLKNYLKVFFKMLWRPLNATLDIWSMPPALLNLFMANLFSWMALHCHDMYFSDFVGKVVFQGNPNTSAILYDKGVRWGAWGLLLQSISATVYVACLQNKFMDIIGQKLTFLLGMATFTVSILGLLLSYNIKIMQLCSVLSGLGMAAVTTIPYDVLTVYCKHPQTYYPGYSSKRGIGEEMAVLDNASFLAQVIPAFFLGFLVDFFGTASVYMVISFLSGVLACYCNHFVIYPKVTCTQYGFHVLPAVVI